MIKRKAYTRILLLLLSFAILLHGGFVMPVFADGVEFTLTLHYQEEREDDSTISRVDSRHPIVLPGGADSFYRTQDTERLTTPYTFNPAEAHRIIGYSFDGWYTQNNGSYADNIPTGGILDDSLVNSYSRMLNLFGKWTEFNSPYITSGSVEFDCKNANEEDITDEINWQDGSGNLAAFTFDKDTTDYQGYVYSDVASVRMRFEQYEPAAHLAVKINGSDVNFDSEDIMGIGFWHSTETEIAAAEVFSDTPTGARIDMNLSESDFTADSMTDGGYFSIEYSAQQALDTALVFVTDDETEIKVSPERTVVTSNGTYKSYFSYNDVKTAWEAETDGEDISVLRSTLSKLYIENDGMAGAANQNMRWVATSWWDADPDATSLQEHDIVTGKNITTDYIPLDLTSTEQEYNVITVEVRLPLVTQQLVYPTEGTPYYEEVLDYDQGANRTYTFRIKRYDSQLIPAYGNTPYGRIMSTSGVSAETKISLKNSFDSTLTYGGRYYTDKAWWHSADTTAADEKKRGTALTAGSSEFINYDKDETAIVVFNGDRFTDPGVTINYNGATVTPTSENPVKRKITVRTHTDLKYQHWASTSEYVDNKNLTGGADDNIITLLQDENVVPGIYTIEYEYDPEPSDANVIPLTAHRYMIVMPKLSTASTPYRYDVNMDNYINALDTLIYNDTAGIAAESDAGYTTISEYLYRYRVLDVAPNGRGNGIIDDTDKQYVIGTSNVSEMYTSLSLTEAVSQQTYTSPSTPTAGYAQLYMDYLGKNADTVSAVSTGAGNTVSNTEALEKGNTFYVGYRFDNLANLAEGALREITLSVNYDRRYVSPVVTNASALVSNYILPYNTHLNSYDITAAAAETYAVDSSTAFFKWNSKGENGTDADNPGDISQIRTLKLTMRLKDGETYSLADDTYFLKLPFIVNNVPMNDGRKVIATQLGANTFNIDIGTDAYYMWNGGFMWDTTGELSPVTANLYTTLDYMGDYVPSFTGEDDAIKLDEIRKAVYGETVAYSGLETKGSIESGNTSRDDAHALPSGMLYNETAGTISGIPKEVGDFVFYINGVKYSLHVDKAELTVTANNKTKVYGDANPALDFVYDVEHLTNNDDWDSVNNRPRDGVITTAPELVCTADDATDVCDDYPITFRTQTTEGEETVIGESPYYTFVFVPSVLEITPKPITITTLEKIPSFSITGIPNAVSSTSARFRVSDRTDSGGTLVASGLINGDQIEVTYFVHYQDTQSSMSGVSLPASGRPVTIEEIGIDTTTYTDGRNYELQTTSFESRNLGTITNARITNVVKKADCKLSYTYGEPLNLDTGTIRITYDDNNVVDMTFLGAMRAGINVVYRDKDKNATSIVPVHGEKLTVADSGKSLFLSYTENSVLFYTGTNDFSIVKKELHVKADDKERYYGQDNSAAHSSGSASAGWTYTFTDTSEIVLDAPYTEGGVNKTTAYGDTEATVRSEIAGNTGMLHYLTRLSDGNEADADTEIDKEQGYTTADILFSADNVLANYVLVCDKGTLTINKRPITITTLTDATTLTADYYQNADGTIKTAPYYAPLLESESLTALAGGEFAAGESANMTVTDTDSSLGLYTRTGETNPDRVGIRYHVRYNTLPSPLTDTDNYYVDYVHKSADGTGFEDGVVLDDDIGRSYNYVLTDDTETHSNIGTVKTRKIKNITVNEWLRTSYTYGTKMDYETGSIDIEYDNGALYEGITFDKVSEHPDLLLEYTPDTTGTGHGDKDMLDVADSGKQLKLSVIKTQEDYPAYNFSELSPELEISKHILRVKADDITTIYGTNIDEYTNGYKYTFTNPDEDFQYGENEAWLKTNTVAAYTPPTIKCYEEDGKTEANEKTVSEKYRIRISGAEASNYDIQQTEGQLLIRQKPLIITTVNNIPALTAENAHKMQSGEDVSVDYTFNTENGNLSATEDSNVTITFDPDNKPLWNDWVVIGFKTEYDDPTAEGTAKVNILNPYLDRTQGSQRNYYLYRVDTPQSGFTDSAIITNFAITYDPVFETVEGDTHKVPYIYGDTLDLSRAKFEITYDSGRVDSDVTLDKLSEYGITYEYTRSHGTVTDGVFVTIADFDGESITFTLPTDATVSPEMSGKTYTTDTFTVAKRPLHIKIDDASYTYGDTPLGLFAYEFEAGDFADGESDSVISAAVKTAITDAMSCTAFTDENLQGRKLGAGTYADTIVATIDNGTTNINDSIDNYYIVCDDDGLACDASGGKAAGTMTVTRREIEITAITDTSVIPKLSARDAAEHNYILPIDLHGEASNSQLTLGNLANDDEIVITFDARYASLENNDSAPVEIINVDFKSDCAARNNYTINRDTLVSASVGEAHTRLLESIEVLEDPDKPDDMSYVYGDWLNIESGSVQLTYDSGEQPTYKFSELKEQGIDIAYVKYDDEAGSEADGATAAEITSVNTLLTVPEHNGTRIKVMPSANADTVSGIQPAYSKKTISVSKRDFYVTVEDQSKVYSDAPSIDSTLWAYDTSGFVNGDSLLSPRFRGVTYSEPRVVSEKINGAELSIYTPAGDYEILTIEGGQSPNYNFIPVKGTMHVTKKPLRIASVNGDGARNLTSALIYANPGATEITVNGSKAVYTVYDKDISFENGYGVAFNDEIGITYGEIYYAPFNVSADHVQVKIAPDSVLFDSEHTDNDNYYIDDVTTDFVKGGRIINERVTDVTLNADPTLRDDTHMPIAYTHGDSINLNRGSVSVTFDSGKVLNDLTFSEVKTATDGMVTVVYNDGGTDVEIENGDKLIRAKNNGVPLKLKVTENMGVTEPETAALSVSKAVMRVVPTASERYYGDENPSFAYKYYIGDTEYTATASEDFIQGVVPPMAYSNAGIKAPVGEYDILLQGGSSTNYEYVLEKGTLTVIKRPFDVLEILSGIPPLTSQIIYENPGQYHLLSGSATCTSGQLRLGNFSAGDDVRITYDALYSSVDDSQPADVSIVNVLLDESYGEGGNYVLRGTPYVSGGGNIYGKQILYVTTVRQPKLDYTYGDKLDISEKGVSIAYDDGSTVPNIAYSDLAAYGVKLTFTDNDGTVTDLSDPAAAEDIELDVNTHDGAYFTLEATSSNKVSKVRTKPIIVSKKPLNVNIGSFRSVYGENHTAFYTYAYNTDDFVNGDYDTDESKTEEGVISTEPTFVCLDRGGRAVSSETDVGTYTITMTGGESDNYRFIYNNGILTVSRRPLVITNILKTKIPELSSRTIFEIEGTEHRLPASAEDGYLEFDDNDYGVSLLTGDKVRINFTAVYYSNDKSSSCPVGIEYNGMDTSYEQSNNYEIDTVNSVKRIEDGGVIHDREIESIDIDEQPNLNYTYGDRLNFEETGGKIHIYYDDGFDEVIDFKDYASHRLAIMYEQDGTVSDASTSDRLYVTEHTGKHIRLRASSVHNVEQKTTTSAINIEKYVLTFGRYIFNAPVYDGVTTTVQGTVKFADPQNGDDVTATATYIYDSSDLEAGDDKAVEVTDIRLISPYDLNYELPSEVSETTGRIIKASDTVSIDSSALSLSDATNDITITPPEMTETQLNGGAVYEYSCDGGNSWQTSNVFTGLTLGTEYDFRVRFAETDNYNVSETQPTEPLNMSTYKVKLTLISKDKPKTEDEDYRVLRSFYTNTTEVENEEEFRELIGPITELDENGEEKEVPYYTLYTSLEDNTNVKFPLSFLEEDAETADVTIYTTLTAPRRGGGGGGGGGGTTNGNSFVIRYGTEDGSRGNHVTEIKTTTDTDTISLVADTDTEKNVIWNSDNEEVATVKDGIVTIRNAGTAVITAYVDGQKSLNGTVTITVTQGTSVKPTASPQPTSKPSSGENNEPYIMGYEKMIKPDDYMTRAEAATIMIKLAGEEEGDYENIFPDVKEDTWYVDIIAEAAARGLVAGFEDGNFYPEETVTREQFAAMMVRLADLEPVEGKVFNDVEEMRWSAGSINAAWEAGVVTGYADGTFLPENPIRRSEAVRMANVATGRVPDKELIDTVPCPYIDLPKTHWAYYEFMIASVAFEVTE